jgi:alkanesulfonate monooxygenase SsuD/methylene tetrahydromethanopterin reductase-like flavin-dependent oxidoreductase (luciferase family)
MRFGIFYEHQLPRPWVEGSELRLFQEALDQVELADRLGIDFAWEVEHHFLRNTPTPLPPRCSSPPARSAPSA